MTQPLRRLQTAAHAIGEGNLNITVTSKANDETGALVKAFNQMVSEIKQRREEQAQYERDLAWKEMAKQVAHEIKNPLTPMKLSVQHLQQAFKDKVKDFDKIVFRVTKTIIEQIDSLARIATEFSHFSRMPVRKFESVELHNLLEETISLFKGVKGIEIQKEFSIINPIVIADKDELRRVFINIVRNSVQAIEKNGLIKMQTSVQNDKCTISISDTGIGIQPEHLPNVLKPNFSTKAGGMGLGLAICRQIITDLNGSINVSSVYGRGTKVEIILPVSQNIA
jgi:nitrogen fixation/metabolism regulation signal transduction histidine kinase